MLLPPENYWKDQIRNWSITLLDFAWVELDSHQSQSFKSVAPPRLSWKSNGIQPRFSMTSTPVCCSKRIDITIREVPVQEVSSSSCHAKSAAQPISEASLWDCVTNRLRRIFPVFPGIYSFSDHWVSGQFKPVGPMTFKQTKSEVFLLISFSSYVFLLYFPQGSFYLVKVYCFLLSSDERRKIFCHFFFGRSDSFNKVMDLKTKYNETSNSLKVQWTFWERFQHQYLKREYRALKHHLSSHCDGIQLQTFLRNSETWSIMLFGMDNAEMLWFFGKERPAVIAAKASYCLLEKSFAGRRNASMDIPSLDSCSADCYGGPYKPPLIVVSFGQAHGLSIEPWKFT